MNKSIINIEQLLNSRHDIVKDTEKRLHPDFTNGEILKEIDVMK